MADFSFLNYSVQNSTAQSSLEINLLLSEPSMNMECIKKVKKKFKETRIQLLKNFGNQDLCALNFNN